MKRIYFFISMYTTYSYITRKQNTHELKKTRQNIERTVIYSYNW